MSAGGEIVFWFAAAWLGYVYMGYPICLAIFGIFHRFQGNTAEGYFPQVSVLISARNEGKDIGWKVRETLDWEYPPDRLEVLVASDSSEDNTDAILSSMQDPRLRYFRLKQRQGKNNALNHLFEYAQGEILFFTDANSHIERDSLRKLVRHFADHRVGCVTGSEHTIREGSELAVVSGTRAFLGYESLVNTLESRLGSVLVCDGSVFCIRRSLFHRLEPDLANDFELPIRIASQGSAILFDHELWSFERATCAPDEEFRRKWRICGQGILGFWRLRRCLHGLRAWQFLSRKMLRWLGLIPMAMLLTSSAFLYDHFFFASALFLQAIFYALAFVGWWFATRGREASRLITLPFYFVLVNVAAFKGILDACRGKRFSVWDSPARSRGLNLEEPQVETKDGVLAASALEERSELTTREYCGDLRAGKS